MNTPDQTYSKAKIYQINIINDLISVIDRVTITEKIIIFEDQMNGLSGELQNLVENQKIEIQKENQNIKNMVSNKGFDIFLDDSVLLKDDRENNNELITVLAKKLYPRTESIQIDNSTKLTTTSDTKNTAAVDNVVVVESIDPIFDEIDSDAAAALDTYEPIAESQNDPIPSTISDELIIIAEEAAANTEGLEAGLMSFSYNPLAEIIDDTKDLLIYYTENNYANLNTALATINSDPAISTEYKAFQDSIGGNDGLSASIAQLDAFRDHTDRLAGLVLDETSPNSESLNDTTVDNLALNDFSGGPTILFSFDSKKFRSAKYMVQASADLTDRGHQATELYILHDNHHAFTREVTSIYTQEPFVTFTTRLINNKVEVLANTSVNNTNFVIYGTRLKIAKDSKSYPEMSQKGIIELHENISSVLDNEVDYVQLMSLSLLREDLIANLAREFRDYINIFGTIAFATQTDSYKQAALLTAANIITDRRLAIQASIDEDFNNFVQTRKLSESLDIAYNLTASLTDTIGNIIPLATLNNRTIAAIGHKLI